MPPPRRDIAGVAALVALAAAMTWLLYGATLDYGFDYDDYHFVRPYSSNELKAVFGGPWDSQGIERPFYRPLTIAAFALRFERLGLNARAHHALSLVLFAVAAALAGIVVTGLTSRWSGGAAATMAFAAHPAMPYALVAWVTNQMHLVEIVVILAALAWWTAVRARTLVWWLPLLAAGASAFLIKEDGVMLLPAIAVLHALRRRMIEPELPPMPRAFVALAAALLAGLLALRTVALQGIGGYALTSIGQAWRNFSTGLDGVVRLVPADRPWQVTASVVATALPLAALALWRRASSGARYGIASGAAIALLFNLPFVFVTKGEQMHVVAAGVVILLAASALALADAARSGAIRAALVAFLAVGVFAFAAVARDISRDFEPFGPIVLSHDRLVSDWGPVSQELRGFTASKLDPHRRSASANPVDSLPLAVLGVHPFETSPQGVRYRWMSSARAEIQVSPPAREVVVTLRHEAGAFREPAHVEIRSDGRLADRLDLTDDAWHVSRVALRPFTSLPLSRMHRIAIVIPHAWIPSTVIPGSTDNRVLGLQIGEVEVRR